MQTPSAPVGDQAAPQAPAPETPATPAPETPASTPATTENPTSAQPAPAAQASSQPLSEQIDQIEDLDTLDAILEESDRQSPAPISSRKQKKASDAPQPNKPASETPAPSKTPATDTPAASDDEAPMRLWMKSLSAEDRALATAAVNMVRESQRDGGNLTIRQAFAKLAGTENPTDRADQTDRTDLPKADEPTGIAAFDARLTDQDAKISEQETAIEKLEQDLSDAEDNYVSKEEKLKIRKDLRAAEKALNRLERERDRIETEKAMALEDAEYEATEVFDTAYRTALAEAVQILPGSATKGHQDFEDVLTLKKELHRKNPRLFEDPEYPVYIASLIVARRHAAGTRQGPNDQFPAPARVARDVPPVAGADATTAQPFTRDAVLARIEEMDPEELDQLADAIGTKAPDSRKRR